MSFKATGPKTRPDRVKPTSSTDHEDHTPLSRRSSNASSIASFHSAHFPPEEEARFIAASNELKSSANAQFAKQDFSSALSIYDRAVAELPSYLNYELAVLSSNIAACYLRLEEWKEALQAAEKGMEKLEKVLPMPQSKSEKKDQDTKVVPNGQKSQSKDGNDTKIVELPEDTDIAAEEEILKNLDISDQRRADVLRIRTKLLLRRARARYMLGTIPPPAKTTPSRLNAQSTSIDSFSTASSWSNLSSAQSDYTILFQPDYFSTLPATDKKTVRTALATLPPLIEEAKSKEVSEMMGKLKDLGNGILKPFGLSTDMFRMEKDESTGGMNLKFDGSGKKN